MSPHGCRDAAANLAVRRRQDRLGGVLGLPRLPLCLAGIDVPWSEVGRDHVVRGEAVRLKDRRMDGVAERLRWRRFGRMEHQLTCVRGAPLEQLQHGEVRARPAVILLERNAWVDAGRNLFCRYGFHATFPAP